MNSIKIIALVYCLVTLWSYFSACIKSPEMITVSFLGVEKKIPKQMFVLANLLDGALLILALGIIFDKINF